MSSLLKTRSLRLRLIIILSLISLAIWLISSLVVWRQAYKEVNEVFDTQQILLAKRLSTSSLRQILIERHRNGGFHENRRPVPHHYDDDAMAFAIFTRHGEMLLNDEREGANFIFAPKPGFTETAILGDDDLWRIFWLPSEDGKLVIAVGQELEYRQDLITDMVFTQVGVWIIALPIFLGLIIFFISREMSELNRVADNVVTRSPDDITPISETNLPNEIKPLVQSLNSFFDRTSHMLQRERRFTSDAAHELRSPLAALRVQTELAQLADDDVQLRQEALGNLLKSIDRASQIIDRLLTLSRLDNLDNLDQLESFQWQELIESVLNEQQLQAEKSQITLDFETIEMPVITQGQPLLVSLMIRNLVDNALRYCPEKSKISLKLHRTFLTIEDNGGGVEPEVLDKLGQRFYRPAGQNEKGSGLGLSIVFRIAELHRYKIQLENVENEQKKRVGLKATIHF